ncbi:MAG: dihydroneopterin aldolase [Flavobacteriales bacterium]|nr:dihydroneopterin aldolase [Flavobacteriales bacterium]
MGLVLVEDLEVFAYHGHFKEEQLVGRNFVVNLMVETDFTKAIKTDELDGTVDYSKLCAIIHEQMAIPSKLLEHVGGRIIEKVKTEFGDTIFFVELKIAKINTPLPGKIGAVSIVMREEFR